MGCVWVQLHDAVFKCGRGQQLPRLQVVIFQIVDRIQQQLGYDWRGHCVPQRLECRSSLLRTYEAQARIPPGLGQHALEIFAEKLVALGAPHTPVLAPETPAPPDHLLGLHPAVDPAVTRSAGRILLILAALALSRPLPLLPCRERPACAGVRRDRPPGRPPPPWCTERRPRPASCCQRTLPLSSIL